MNICLVVSSLTCGGAERVVATLATKFQTLGHQVTVVTISSEESDFYTIPASVQRIGLNRLQDSKNLIAAIANNFSRVIAIRKVAKSTNADIIVSHLTETNILSVLAGLGTKVPVIITEHCDPENLSYGKFWSVLRRLAYPQTDLLVSVSDGVENFFHWIAPGKKRVIYNPFFIPSPGNASSPHFPFPQKTSAKSIISMGRLTHQKGFDILLKAFASIADRYPDWSLTILGDGELRDDLEKLIEDLGIASRVALPGRVSDPFLLLGKADLFVMSSRFEGFPMAHGEAMLCGLPVIATDCPSGPRELIRDKIDGLLVPNSDQVALQAAMEHLMSDTLLRRRMSKSAMQVAQRFDVEKIVDDWINSFIYAIDSKKEIRLRS